MAKTLYTAHKNFTDEFKCFYNSKPYLKILTEGELCDRLYGIIDNIVEFDWDFNFSIHANNNEMGIAFFNVITEYELRGIDINPLIQQKVDFYKYLIRKVDFSKVIEISNKISGMKVLFRYTESKFEDFWMNKNIWFNKAEEYSNDKFCEGIKDDEQKITSKVIGLTMTNLKTGQTVPVKNNEISEQTCSYYISSFSLDLNPKLFVLLSETYDICFVITNADRYINEVKDIILKTERPINVYSDCVEYIDENRRMKGKKPLFLRKRYKYNFEKEFRVAFYPTNEEKNKSFRLCKYNSEIISIKIIK